MKRYITFLLLAFVYVGCIEDPKRTLLEQEHKKVCIALNLRGIRIFY